jgi:hypothetical protein
MFVGLRNVPNSVRENETKYSSTGDVSEKPDV